MIDYNTKEAWASSLKYHVVLHRDVCIGGCAAVAVDTPTG